ncbi:MAG: VOC family protein [Candidatus Sericytochromatia bacterium]|nr:VOC family protein [Candidatus Tanganyikabacteria bacterium]
MAVELAKAAATGTFCWVELHTSDVVAAKTFYTKLLGWSLEDLPIDETMSYTMASVDGKNVAALQPQMPDEIKMGAPPNWFNYIAVDSADKYAAKARELGGQVFAEPFDVMDAGRMAVVADPTGAVFGLWQAGKHAGADLVEGEPGSFCWNELYTNDTGKASAFYCGLFGYTIEKMEMGEGGEYLMFVSTDPKNPYEAGMMDPKQGFPPYWQPYFSVADTDATVAKATELGGKVLMPPEEIGQGRFAILQDPQGAVFGIIKLKKQ